MLQWGIETASARLLDLTEKGVPPERAGAALAACSAAGIRNHAFLLFGLPTETDADREETLGFVRREAGVIGDLNVSLLNLPRRSPMHDRPSAFGITEILAFHGDADLALYDDFRCGASHPRLEARRWLGRRFFRDPAVKGILGGLNAPFKANHSCFLR
jgi:anaerobic magnesium-protoporphyrin IX monomethyl ester cyclase